VAGTESSFHSLSVSRKHLEKTEGAEKDTRQGGIMPEEEGLGSWVEIWGGIWGDSLLHWNLPFRVQLHLELHQAGRGRKQQIRPGTAMLSPKG
jgi:hypothetical protein